MSEETWTNAEMVRGIKGLIEAVKDLTDSIHADRRENDIRYVSRELYVADTSHTKGRLDEVSREVVDLRADYTRSRKEQAESATTARRFWTATVVSSTVGASGVAVALVSLATR